MRGTVSVGVAIAALLLAGCGMMPRRRDPSPRAASYLPLELGAVWRYAITTDDGRRSTGTVSIDGVDYGGSNGSLPEYRIREELPDETIWTWEDRQAGRLAREQEEVDDRAGTMLDEETFDPPLTVLDERPDRLTAGNRWPEVVLTTTPNAKGHPRTRRAEVQWEVQALADPVTVPAGTFTCLRVRRTWKHHPPLVSWYAKAIGLVKQTGAGSLGDQTLTLVEAKLP